MDNERNIRARMTELTRSIGKMHAEACSHRLNKNMSCMHDVHKEIAKTEIEIKECAYLLEWVHVECFIK